ncbi:MAG: hypothetical protein IR527_02565 [Bacteroides sp.]|nr:MAG: hypothetical protein IR527_02565 [Bacteroides sp.]
MKLINNCFIEIGLIKKFIYKDKIFVIDCYIDQINICKIDYIYINHNKYCIIPYKFNFVKKIKKNIFKINIFDIDIKNINHYLNNKISILDRYINILQDDYFIIGFEIYDSIYGFLGKVLSIEDVREYKLLYIYNSKNKKKIIIPLTNKYIYKYDFLNRKLLSSIDIKIINI